METIPELIDKIKRIDERAVYYDEFPEHNYMWELISKLSEFSKINEPEYITDSIDVADGYEAGHSLDEALDNLRKFIEEIQLKIR